eukprot:TRINITY_DN4069_c1_g4_i1.p2 TRINITY_DN4069_c1_g4~~TRINITY_DN4069_c1_g4_i1.p2  ORF type:complete len:111 (-),score=5.39 TRINITY_DN4069_c1_g4_i1:7-339(-)
MQRYSLLHRDRDYMSLPRIIAACPTGTCLPHFPADNPSCRMVTSSLNFKQGHGLVSGELWRDVASALFSHTMLCMCQGSPTSCSCSGYVSPPALARSHIVILFARPQPVP